MKRGQNGSSNVPTFVFTLATSCSNLNHLQSGEGGLTNAYIKSIKVVKTGWNKNVYNTFKSLKDRKDLILESCLNWKKIDLITKLICLSSLKSFSNITPKFFTEGFTNGFKTPKSRSGDPQAPPGVNNITSVLSSLNLKNITAIQALISQGNRYNCVSSAWQWNKILYFLKMDPRGSIYIRKMGLEKEDGGAFRRSGCSRSQRRCFYVF